MTCKVCGGTMHGNGVTMIIHCENTDAGMWDIAPDAGPVYCDGEDKYTINREDGYTDAYPL